MLFAAFLTLLIASVSTEGVTISPASSQGSKCLQVRDFDNIKNRNAVQMLVEQDITGLIVNIFIFFIYFRSDCSEFVAPSQSWQINLGVTFVRLDPLVDLGHNFCMDAVNGLCISFAGSNAGRKYLTVC